MANLCEDEVVSDLCFLSQQIYLFVSMQLVSNRYAQSTPGQHTVSTISN